MDMNDIETIEVSIEEAMKVVKRGDALERLMKNRDFKMLFLDGYFKEEAHRLVSISADPTLKQHHSEIMDSIRAISMTQQYTQLVARMADMARQQIEDLQGERDFLEEQEE